MGNILRINKLVCGYNKKEILREISFSVEEGSFLGVIGPNGSGKTTLFRAITRILKPFSGEIFYRERVLEVIPRRAIAREIAVLPQLLNVTFPCLVEEFVFMGRFPYARRLTKVSGSDEKAVREAMVLADVLNLRKRKFQELSGGERQRVVLAQALAQEPRLLLLDEPTAHLDIGHQIEILDLVRKLNREKGVTIIMVSHDLNLAAEYCEELILLQEGRIYRQGTPEEVLSYKHVEAVYNTVVVVKENPSSGKPYVVLVPGQKRPA